MSFFNQTPLVKIADVGVDSHNGSNDKETSCNINEEEWDSMKIDWNFSGENSDDDSKDPEDSKIESMILEEIVLLDEGLCLSK